MNPPRAPKMDPRIVVAIVRGDLVRQKLAVDEGGSVSSGSAARLLGSLQGDCAAPVANPPIGCVESWRVRAGSSVAI
jgi:hypothetical protein